MVCALSLCVLTNLTECYCFDVKVPLPDRIQVFAMMTHTLSQQPLLEPKAASLVMVHPVMFSC